MAVVHRESVWIFGRGTPGTIPAPGSGQSVELTMAIMVPSQRAAKLTTASGELRKRWQFKSYNKPKWNGKLIMRTSLTTVL